MTDPLIFILPLAAVGAVLGWDRALPVRPVRSWAILTLDKAYNFWPFPFIWKFLIGVLGCAECMSPYIGFLFSLLYFGFGILPFFHALVTYALYVVLMRQKDSDV